MKAKLADDMYPSVSCCVADFEQIVRNAVIYNGEDHRIAKCARKIKVLFDELIWYYPKLHP